MLGEGIEPSSRRFKLRASACLRHPGMIHKCRQKDSNLQIAVLETAASADCAMPAPSICGREDLNLQQQPSQDCASTSLRHVRNMYRARLELATSGFGYLCSHFQLSYRYNNFQ